MACPLYRFGYLALIFQRVAGDTSWQDLALVIDKLYQEVGILVVNMLDSKFFETAVLFAELADVWVCQKLDFVFGSHDNSVCS